MIVVDTNILLAAEIDGSHHADAARLLGADRDWRVPPLWRYVFCNALATMVRAGQLAPAVARQVYRSAQARFGPGEQAVDHDRVLKLALAVSMSAYDATFLALAMELDAPLITEDRALRLKSGERARSLKEYLANDFMAGDAAPAAKSRATKGA